MRRLALFAAALCCILAATAQTKKFTVAAMNVDGMPKSIKVLGLFDISLNPDAKEEAGATAIGKKLAEKEYDIVGVSEDFNYNDQILAEISSIYSAGTHRGRIKATASAYANYVVKNPLFDTDGLNIFWRSNVVGLRSESWTKWNDHYGYDKDGADGLIKKGFRYYLADFGDGVLVDIYILHMDAETADGDIAARESQMRQLVDDILRINPSQRPKIVMGDTNCRYTRDHVKTLFIDAINADPRYTIQDGWIEKCKSGTYPAYGSNALMVDALGYEQGEIVDKLFYINPKYGMQLQLTKFLIDTDFNGEDGEPLADHYPVVGSFSTKGTLYDPASYWDGSHDSPEYRAYARAYNSLLPLTVPTLREPLKSQMAALLTEHVAPGSDIVSRIDAFRADLKANMAERYTEEDYTQKIANPSFEEGARLATGNVQGWDVPADVTEAFISGVIDNDEGAAIRNFEPHDGNYVFNTWGGYPAGGFYCRQTLKNLARGWYRLEAVLATDAGGEVCLRFDDTRITTGIQNDRTRGQRIEAIVYHPGGNATIGAESEGWFEADDFRLYHFKSIPNGIDDIPVEEPTSQFSTLNSQPSTLYSPDGRRLAAPRRGINIVRRADGTTQKVLVR